MEMGHNSMQQAEDFGIIIMTQNPHYSWNMAFKLKGRLGPWERKGELL